MKGDLQLLRYLRRRLAGAMGARGGGALALFLMHAGLARLLGVEGYGVFSYALSVSGLIAPIVPLGWPLALVRFIPEYREKNQWDLLRGMLVRAHQITLATALLCSLAIYAVSLLPFLSRELAIGLVGAAAITPLRAYSALRRRGFQGFERVWASLLPDEVVLPICVTILAFVLALQSGDEALGLYVAVALVVLVTSTIWFWRTLPAEVRVATSRFRTRYWTRTAMPMALGQVNRLVFTRTDVLMLGLLADMETVGAYGLAMRLAQLIVLPLYALNAVLPALISRAFHGGDRSRAWALVRVSMIVAGATALPIAFGMTLLSDWILGRFGAGFEAGSMFLTVLAAGYLANASAGSAGAALMMIGQEAVFAKSMTVAAILNVTANAILIPLYWGIGAASATASSLALAGIWQFVAVRRTLANQPGTDPDAER